MLPEMSRGVRIAYPTATGRSHGPVVVVVVVIVVGLFDYDNDNDNVHGISVTISVLIAPSRCAVPQAEKTSNIADALKAATTDKSLPALTGYCPESGTDSARSGNRV